jgi:hypothetical protein
MHSTREWEVFIVLFPAFFLCLFILQIARKIKKAGRPSWFAVVMWSLMLVGCVGFFGALLAADGILKFPKTFEWPAGYVKGVARMANGDHVVPLKSSSRLQLYDEKWRFLRGWHVDTLSSDFKVECPSDGLIEVYTAKGRHLYTFTEQGERVSSTKYDGDFESLPASDSYVAIPTSPAGWLFSGQFISLGIYCFGLLGLGIEEKFVKRRRMMGKSQTAN